MDEFLPVWAQPHRFVVLDQRQREVFTFGLVLTEMRGLAHPEGVRSFGLRFGYEWLAGLSAGVQRELRASLSPSDVEVFLREEHGILGPNELDSRILVGDYDALQEPPDSAMQSFATTHGALIHKWAGKAFSLVEASLGTWALARERVPRGHAVHARRRLEQTKMQHALIAVHGLDGAQRWARGYETVYERAALELEDIAVRRPRPRICPLCQRIYIPLRPGQAICTNQIWDALSKKLVRRCTPQSEASIRSAVDARAYRRRRKTRWAAMNRVRKRYGYAHVLTERAIADWEAWCVENPSPRPRGRPPRVVSEDAERPPFLPSRG